MNTDQLIHFLTQASRFSSRMQAERNQLVTAQTVKEAAVLVGIVLHERMWQILLTKRAETLRQHTGQIAFAGGRKDAQDNSLTATALREAYEETAIPITVWQTFAPLPFYDTPSGYRVTPVPAICTQPVTPKANPDEVAEIFYLPLDFALNLQNYTFRQLHHNNQILALPTLPFRRYDIWGLTALILYGLAERYQQYCQAFK
ncbi:CoA pyrophosphatase [Neisseria mucosa]|uniref:CoA pyrophosphatase n=1 Tax=Neisseria mucosa TaxID=488 RepID=UPI00051DC205|nr:CoA pyrophosphatase [Neisseria mucosa]KGJ33121.1 NUDIX hydrolase [Neisseria mucosa]